MWSRFNVDEEWWSWDVVGASVEMINWGDGMDSVGEGYYPIGHKGTLSGGIKNFYTISHSHNHRIDIPDFFTGLPGEHTHSVDIPNTASTTAFTSDVMPYIQFLVCEKD